MIRWHITSILLCKSHSQLINRYFFEACKLFHIYCYHLQIYIWHLTQLYFLKLLVSPSIRTILICVYFSGFNVALGIMNVSPSVSLDNIPDTIYWFACNFFTYLHIKLWELISFGFSKISLMSWLTSHFTENSCCSSFHKYVEVESYCHTVKVG